MVCCGLMGRSRITKVEGIGVGKQGLKLHGNYRHCLIHHCVWGRCMCISKQFVLYLSVMYYNKKYYMYRQKPEFVKHNDFCTHLELY